MKRFILALSLALLPSTGFAAETQPHTIAVMGEAEMQIAPDYALIEVGVISQAKTVVDALQDNSTKMSRVVDAIRNLGIADTDIHTSTFDIRPKYEPEPQGSYDPQAFRPIIGYAVANRVTVTVNDTSKIAKIIDATVAAGANASGEVDFRIRNLTEQMDKVRKAAVESAHHKAQVLTSAADMVLGAALSITDNQADTSYNDNPGGFESVIVTASKIRAPILAGQIKVVARVTVVYATQ